ncbi:MAG TPA: hypothetical protein VEU11_17625 [Terriglobales bacterium]|nr:hypothetical protein [Terriglobales bacterium]
MPDFLFKSYKDTGVQELFGIKVFTLRVRYTGTGPDVFETECEILFRPWKKETKIGRTARKILPAAMGARRSKIYAGATSGSHSAAALELSNLCSEARQAWEDYKNIVELHATGEVSKTPFSRWRPFVGDPAPQPPDIQEGIRWARFLENHIQHIYDWAARWGEDISEMATGELFQCVGTWRTKHRNMSGDKCLLLLEMHTKGLQQRLESLSKLQV